MPPEERSVRSITTWRAFFRWHGRLANRCPNILHNINSAAHIAASRNCPNDLARIGNINIVVHDNNEFASICACAGTSRDQQRLFGVAGIALLDRDHRKGSGLAAVDKTPDAFDLGYACLLELFPERRG